MGTPKRPALSEVDIIPDDLNSILDMSIRSMKLARNVKFPDTEEGLEDFKAQSLSYLEYVKRTNNDPDNENHIIPDIEGWGVYLGTTRRTINNYQNVRSEEWQEFIAYFKGIITSCKKQLIFRQKIPPVVGIFDLTNNSDYVNSSEFKVKPDIQQENKPLTAAELPKLGQASEGQLPNFREVTEE